MRYRIRTFGGTILDRDLSYEDALMWVENCETSKYCIMEPMKEVSDGATEISK